MGPDDIQRGDRIITLAREAFVAKGFEGTSMQDVARSAQMSVGNLYRYFPSKTAIIEALIARHFAGIENELDAIAASPDPLGGLRATLRQKLLQRHAGDRVLSAEIAACIARNPELAAAMAMRMEGLTRRFTRIIGSSYNLPEAAALTCAHAVSLVMHGATTSPSVLGWDDERVTELVFWIIDRVVHGDADDA